MNGTKKTTPTIGKILYGIGGLSAITGVVFLLLFLPEFSGVHEVSLLVAASLGIACPVLVMPLCHAFINGNTAIATGRYHLPLVVSMLTAALSSVLLLGVGGAHPVGQAFALFGLTAVYSLSMQVFSYTYFSVGQRFDQSGYALRVKNVCTMLSVAAALLALLWFVDGTRDSVRATVAFAAIVATLCTLAVYFATVRSMPNFIRLEPYHKRSVKETYGRFVSPLKNRVVLLFSIAAFLTYAAMSAAASALPAFVLPYLLGGALSYKIAVIVMAVAVPPAGILTARLIRKKGDTAGCTAAIAGAAVQAAAAIAVAVFAFVRVPRTADLIATFAFAASAGLMIGIALTGEDRKKAYAVRLSGCSPGQYHCLHNAVGALGVALGLAITSAVRMFAAHTGSRVAVVAALGAYALLTLAGAIVSRTGYSAALWRKFSLREKAEQRAAREEEKPCSP